ncbi:hypothetical protein F5Y16DRAFT_424391 [Xylariaceae sp. FL0255]|nr:hypothetical protein F5Y16DRAFT_424391 [Xylariaceae sp. FL0255]
MFTAGVVNETSFDWVIAIDRTVFNVSFSEIYDLSIYRTGNNDEDGDSISFNITSANNPTSTTPTTSRISISTVGPSTQPPSNIPPPTPATSSSSGGLSMGVKAGLAVGAVVAALVDVLVGWFLVRRRDRNRVPQTTTLETPKAKDNNDIVYGGEILHSPAQEMSKSHS